MSDHDDERGLVGRIDYPLDALTSFHYFKTDGSMQQLVDTGRLRIIGDSGAFSALTQGTPIKMGEYVAWCRRWGPHLYWMAALDVIGDPAATLRNWRDMRDRHQLVTVPTLHVGCDPRFMDIYAREGCDFIGLGGMVGRALQSMPWLVRIFRYARDRHPQMRFHTWGITHRRVLDNLPAYSADSSSFSAGHRYAVMRLFDPATGGNLSVRMQRNDVYRVGKLLRQVYGVAPSLVARPCSANRPIVARVHARAYQLYSQWLQRRHNVAAPTWGINRHAGDAAGSCHLGGPKLHVVSTAAGGGDIRRCVRPDDAGTRLHVVSTRNDAIYQAVQEGP